jgi:hypothetical protein
MKQPVTAPMRVAASVRAVREQHARHFGMRVAVASAKRRVQGRLTGSRQCVIGIGALLEQELAQSPMPMKRRAVEIQIVA